MLRRTSGRGCVVTRARPRSLGSPRMRGCGKEGQPNQANAPRSNRSNSPSEQPCGQCEPSDGEPGMQQHPRHPCMDAGGPSDRGAEHRVAAKRRSWVWEVPGEAFEFAGASPAEPGAQDEQCGDPPDEDPSRERLNAGPCSQQRLWADLYSCHKAP